MKNKLEKIAGPLVGLASGLVIGTIDIFTTGFPLLTSYLGGVSMVSLENYDKEFLRENKKKIFGGFRGYLIGSAVPFYLKYNEEVNNFVEGILK